jgi:hypothetical protein
MINEIDLVSQKQQRDRILAEHKRKAAQVIRYAPNMKCNPPSMAAKLFELACRIIGGVWLGYGAYLLLKQAFLSLVGR